VLGIEPDAGGYFLVTSPDLPGFSMLLEPGEADDIKSLIDALTGPLKAYLEVEGRRLGLAHRAVKSESHRSRPVLKGWVRSDDKLIAAASCT
jgi:hypothetical protein